MWWNNQLQEIVSSGRRYFLSRRGSSAESLTLSTLDTCDVQERARSDRGLAAEGWWRSRAKRPAPVLRLDMADGRVQSRVARRTSWRSL